VKVAMPVFDGRISPVFDWAERLVVAELADGREIRREEASLAGETPPGRVERLVSLGAGFLLCGAISEPLLALAEAAGVKVAPWLCGEAEEVLAAFARGELPAERFAMPGCCGRRWRGGRRCVGARRGRGRQGR
jgi:predicted Fe-Mo cluster-binding NifX family protein